MVPAGAVHCISMGMHSNKQQVTLHAMGGTLSHPRPQVNHAAFSDQSLEFSGSSRTASYDSGSAEFSIDADGRAVLDADDIEAEGDVGSNRYLSFMDSSEANGEITQPSEFKNASMLQSPYVDLADVLSLDRPVDVVKVPAPPKPPELEVQQALTDTLQVTVNTLAQSMNAVTFIKGFTSNQTVNSTFSKGEYFFPDGLNIQGTITLSQDVDNDNPVVIYSGGDVVLGPSAKVNLNRPAKQLQLYFVKDDESDVQRLKMSGNSQLFATAVGSQLEAELEDDAQLYGGIMARTVKASGNARLFFDKALTDDSLDTEGAWRFSGITEPKPETVMVQGGVLQLAAVRVKDGTVTYAQPVLPKANTMIMIDPGTMTAVQ